LSTQKIGIFQAQKRRIVSHFILLLRRIDASLSLREVLRLQSFKKNRSFGYQLATYLLFTTPTIFAADIQDAAPVNPPDVSQVTDAIPKALPLSRYGNPPLYEVNGKKYRVLTSNAGYEATGYASWYGTKFQGKRTSSGEPYNMYEMTAASPVLPIPSFVQVTNLNNGKSVVVKVNDRGPFHSNRIMDLSYAAASKLDILRHGTGKVKIVAIQTGVILSEKNHNYLQVAAFSKTDNAISLQKKLMEIVDKPVHLIQTVQNNQPIYRVLIGPITNEQLSSTQDLLTQHGIDESFTVTG
jgi:rare lipoprotein A